LRLGGFGIAGKLLEVVLEKMVGTVGLTGDSVLDHKVGEALNVARRPVWNRSEMSAQG